MRGKLTISISGLLFAISTQAQARPAISLVEAAGGGPSAAVPGVLQCVPFARDTSGIRLHGDAHTWWSQAAGKYARGSVPRPGAVLAIRPHGNSRLGHVATVSRVVDARTILVSHANWSAPGQVERNVTAVDVSPTNDWSQVRMWFAPIGSLGAAHWPVAGFIYNAKPDKPAEAPALAGTFSKAKYPKAAKVSFSQSEPVTLPRPVRPRQVATPAKPARPATRIARLDPRKDPIGAILAQYP